MYTVECRQDFQLTIFICKQLQVDRICTGLIVFVLQWYLHGKCTYLYCNDICMANVFALDLYLLCNCICLMTVFDLQLYKCIYLMTVFALQLYVTYDCICIATVYNLWLYLHCNCAHICKQPQADRGLPVWDFTASLSVHWKTLNKHLNHNSPHCQPTLVSLSGCGAEPGWLWDTE